MLKRIHHLNFVVRDLGSAVRRFERVLGIPVACIDELPGRGARTARFKIGETWLVLVEPVADGAPARHLAAHGEGFFLLSLEVDDLQRAVGAVDARGERLAGEPRIGLDGWQVADLGTEVLPGALLQLCEDRAAPRGGTAPES
jgi:methylmalonyl-CoA/ethylmalonyl-CoA epimerase